MDFRIDERENPHLKHYSEKDLEIARDFAKKAYHEFGTLIKTIVLFGGHAKHKQHHHEKPNDIDILIVVDDARSILTEQAVETYRVICHKLLSDTSKRIHLTTLKLTNFWDYARNGDPIIVNILRDGIALIDTGIFEPLQILLYQGRIRHSYEAIWAYYSRAPTTIHNAKWHVMQAVVDLYWAVIDAAHAALMKLGEIPPTPAHAADMIREKMVKKGLLSQRYASIMRNFYNISKAIIHREVKEIKGRDFDTYLKDADDFVDAMKRIITSKSK